MGGEGSLQNPWTDFDGRPPLRDAGLPAGRLRRSRVLSTLVHTVLFLTASVGFCVSFAILGEERPWTLDIASTEEMLGIGKSAAGVTTAGESLDAWITRLGGKADGDRLRLFIQMLYTCCAAGCCLVCAFLMSVTFLAPRNRPLVFSMQIILCIGVSIYTRFHSMFLSGSRHSFTVYSALVGNWFALALHVVDLYLFHKWRADTQKYGGSPKKD